MDDRDRRRQAVHILARLDLVLSTARLASYYFMVGKLQDAEEQREIAQQDYAALMLDWAALDMDTHVDKELRQKKATVEECLKKLAEDGCCDPT